LSAGAKPIAAGGVAVFRRHFIVADQDGAVLITQAQLDQSCLTPSRKGWKPDRQRVNGGVALRGFTP